MKRILLGSLFLFLFTGVLSAAPITFFGEDLGLGESTPLTSWANASAAQASFLSNLTGVGTENFESYATGTGAPLAISFPGAGTATLMGSGNVNTVTPGNTNGYGRYATSGSKYWETYDVFSITFSQAIAAFGFYGIDIGDFSGQVTLTLENGTTRTLAIPNTIDGLGGGVLYFGVIDTAEPFTKVTFGNTAAGIDVFGFDDMTIGSTPQVVPIPGALVLLGSGLLGLAGFRRKIKENIPSY